MMTESTERFIVAWEGFLVELSMIDKDFVCSIFCDVVSIMLLLSKAKKLQRCEQVSRGSLLSKIKLLNDIDFLLDMPWMP